MKDRNFKNAIIREFDRKTAEETREVEFIISDETRDRHGTVIPLNSWNIEKFNKNGIVGYQHEVHGGFLDSNPDQVLGIGKAFAEDGKLIGRVKFEPAEINPLAEKIFQKVLHGTLKATSVGFIETKKGAYGEKEEARGAENETYYFGEVELLEFSIVNIPSNPNALRRKNENSITPEKADELEIKLNQVIEINKKLENQLETQRLNNQILKMKTASKGQNLK